MKFHYFYY